MRVAVLSVTFVAMTSPVVVDGRLTREKLDELLAFGAEHAELDFKATLTLSDPKHRLGLFKDLIAMSNTGMGGYIVIGANEDGSPATDRDPVDTSRFDSADLGQQLAKYVITAPTVTSQSHEVDGRMVILIHVAPPASGLPIIISRSGEYPDGKHMKAVLVEGVLYVREGTRNVAATDAHWPRMLSRYRNTIVAETRENIDVLIAKVVEGMGEQTGGARLLPLAAEMEDSTFIEAVMPYFDSSEGQNKVRRFLRSLRSSGDINTASVERSVALDKISIVASQAVFADARDSFRAAISILHELYQESLDSVGDYPSEERAKYWLDVLLRVLLIGATAVRDHAWWAIEPLVNREAEDEYVVWLRHAIVYASRANLLSGGQREASMVLVRARALAISSPALAPGLESTADSDVDREVPRDEVLLNALCQFDFLWCVVAVVAHPNRYEGSLFFPSCAALQQKRTRPIINFVAKSDVVRREIMPASDDDAWENALQRVFEVAQKQSFQYGAWWSGHRFDDAGEPFSLGRS